MLTGNTSAKSQGYKRIKATRANLSKSFLFRLQEGEFIVSNLFWSENRPVFAEAASPLNVRQEQWRRIVATKVDQRLCEVFDCKEDADEYLQSLVDIASDTIDSNTGVRYRYVKMNRDLFMSLSEGLPVVSCSFYLDGRPRFYVETSPKPERGEQWKQIVKTGMGRIKCFVFHSQADMQEFFGHRGLFNTTQEAA